MTDPTAPLLRVPAVDDWWRLTRGFPDYRKASHSVLKDYGYMELMALVGDRGLADRRAAILEYGHGFNPALFAAFHARCHMTGVDDDMGLAYFPSGESWDAKRKERLLDPFPDVRFVRGLLGGPLDVREGSQDLVCSVSVMEELDPATTARVVEHAHRLLVPGGLFAGTIDFCVTGADRYFNLMQLLASSGFDFRFDPARPPNANPYTILVENPTAVMTMYMQAAGEDRRYQGHWTTAFFVARKPA